MTAIQELIKELERKRDMWSSNGKISDRNMRGVYVDAIIEAKKLLATEKKQIEYACEWGLNDACEQFEKGGFVKISKGDEYYSETYGSTP